MKLEMIENERVGCICTSSLLFTTLNMKRLRLDNCIICGRRLIENVYACSPCWKSLTEKEQNKIMERVDSHLEGTQFHLYGEWSDR